MSPFRAVIAVAAAILLAFAVAACGGGSSGPQQIADEATLEGVESGNLDLSATVDAKGAEGGRLEIAVSGPFESEGADQDPELDLTASAKGKAKGEPVDFEGGLTLLSNSRAFVEYEGVEYKVDPVTYGYVRGMIRQRGHGESNEVTACLEAANELDVGGLLENPAEEGTVDVGGVQTTKVGGKLNTESAIEALIELTEDPACNEQLDAMPGSLPSRAQLEKAKGEALDAVKNARVELYVGDDHIVRRLTAQATIEQPRSAGGKGAESVDLDVDLELTGVNEEQTIEAPTRSQPLSNLFIKLDVTPFELLELLEGRGGLGRGGINGLLEGLGDLGSGR